MFAKLRECIAFGSNTSPYALTDAEEMELYDFINTLEEEER